MKAQPLAIVIPAYKGAFLRETLEALARQTCKAFHVYIGNDAGSNSIESIVAEFNDRLSIHYVYFPDNLGSTSLVKQWNRCLALTQQEPWIWLLPDDDVPDDTCVERFMHTLDRDKQAVACVYRFNTRVIDQSGIVCELNVVHPVHELPGAFLLARLRGDRYSTVCEYIFNRTQFIQQGGFVEFPAAWFSDDATWIQLSAGHIICTIDGALVSIRQSDLNISNQRGNYGWEKALATFRYVKWLKQLPLTYLDGLPADTDWNALTRRFVRLQLQGAEVKLNWRQWFYLLGLAAKTWGYSFRGIFDPMFDFNPTGITWRQLKK